MLAVNVGDSAQRGLNQFADFVPNLLAALAILIVGYFVAKILGSLVSRALKRVGFDSLLQRGQGGRYVEKVTTSPSRLFGTLTFWAVMLGVISIAVGVLGIQLLENAVAAIWAYVPNVIAALVIFLVAGAISAGVAALARRTMGGTALGNIVATAAPILVMTIATFMILNQLRIAPEIVQITYAGLVFAIALGAALAFGLGGRDVAGRMLEGAYRKGQENKEEFKRDLDQGVSRAKDDVQEMQDQMGDGQRESAATTQVASPYEQRPPER
jgi:hypothetical protein